MILRAFSFAYGPTLVKTYQYVYVGFVVGAPPMVKVIPIGVPTSGRNVWQVGLAFVLLFTPTVAAATVIAPTPGALARPDVVKLIVVVRVAPVLPAVVTTKPAQSW
jgi:hypothetical protein